MTISTTSYIDFLKNEFTSRKLTNGSYSLRAFARDIGLSPSSLSLILKGSQGLSVERAHKIAHSIGMTERQKAFFCDLVESQHGRSYKSRNEASKRLALINSKSNNEISLESFSIISDWYHYAILELFTLKDFEGSYDWISKKLKITQSEAKKAVLRLKKVGLLKENGNFLEVTESETYSMTDIPSAALKKFHKQILKKAEIAIDRQPIQKRDITSATMAINSKYLPEAKKDIENFRRKFMKKYGEVKSKDTVYNLGVQFFSLLETDNNKESR